MQSNAYAYATQSHRVTAVAYGPANLLVDNPTPGGGIFPG